MRNEDNWEEYYRRTRGKDPRRSLQLVLEKFHAENFTGKALDLGSGACNDLDYLYQKKWQACGIDPEPASYKYFQEHYANIPGLSFQQVKFNEIRWQKYDLIHAGFSLPFCERDYLSELIVAIKSNLNLGGRFAGNFFGLEHSWQNLSLVSKKEVEDFFSDFEIELIEETKSTRSSTLGEEIFHHDILVIAKKIK
ncbi:MAG: class I SAM-dependent methyltransferase [Chitinophagales bacterium]